MALPFFSLLFSRMYGSLEQNPVLRQKRGSRACPFSFTMLECFNNDDDDDDNNFIILSNGSSWGEKSPLLIVICYREHLTYNLIKIICLAMIMNYKIFGGTYYIET